MLYFAKIINKETNEVQVGFGTDYEYYKSLGMKKMDIEQAYNGGWYKKGCAPKKPEKLVKEERIDELEKYLKDTDWYTSRYIETKTEIPADISKARQDAREEISRLREEINK